MEQFFFPTIAYITFLTNNFSNDNFVSKTIGEAYHFH